MPPNQCHRINATESDPPLLFRKFRDLILPTQTQAAFGPSEGGSIKAGVGISTHRGFFGVHGKGILFGSDATRVPDDQAGSNQPSRFITRAGCSLVSRSANCNSVTNGVGP